MITSLIWLLVAVAIFAIVYWAINQIALPPPVKVVVIAVLAIIGLLLLVKILMPLIGSI